MKIADIPLTAGLLGHLQLYHTGAENAVHSKVLEKTFHVHGATIRRAVLKLRHAGWPVCSSPHGYFYAANTPEVRGTVNVFNNRLVGAAKVKYALEKSMASMPDAGQTALAQPDGGDAY